MLHFFFFFFFFFFFTGNVIPAGMSLKSIGLELRCQCIKKESRFIHPRQIQNVELFPSGPHCKDAEVIATLKSGDQICLEPTARWVKIVIKKILER
ncbi:Interleukin-8 [Acipenser ruthenus]|uniref:Interleukin-8 n=1 Tax=Acipenser ruthenus TaxID=7906 RepID=A0A662YNL5_ACIRT|nr:Interleukin-8 [Acipenser ruthenus]